MSKLPDYNQLKTVISRQFNSSITQDNFQIEKELLEAEKENSTYEEFQKTKVNGIWSDFLYNLRSEQDVAERIPEKPDTLANLFNDNQTDSFNSEDISIQQAYDYQLIQQSGLVEILGEQELSSYAKLSEVAEQFDVRSWQLIEFIESLREELGICPIHYAQIQQPNEISVNPNLSADVGSQVQTSSIKSTIDPSKADILHKKSEKKSVTIKAILAFAGVAIVISLIYKASNNNIENIPFNEISSFRKMGESYYPVGSNLAISDRMCNRKGPFCIFMLGSLVNSSKTHAEYTHKETINGKYVSINGRIKLEAASRENNPNRFAFNWEDDRSRTTMGYAGKSSFSIESNNKSQGFSTRFTTKTSLGIYAPVGLKNSAIIFQNNSSN